MEKERRKKSLNSQSCSKYPAPSGNERLLPPPAANPGTFVVGVYFPVLYQVQEEKRERKRKKLAPGVVARHIWRKLGGAEFENPARKARTHNGTRGTLSPSSEKRRCRDF